MARYESEFNPILLENQTATLYGMGVPENGLNVKCLAVGALPENWKDFGALTGGSWDTDQSDTNLEMNTMELAQFRIRVVSEMKLRLKHPSSVTQWKTKNATFYLPQFPTGEGVTSFLQEYYWKASEFFVFEDHTPVFDLYANRTTLSAIVLFSGWRFKLQTISQPGRIALWTSEWPSTSPTPRYPR